MNVTDAFTHTLLEYNIQAFSSYLLVIAVNFQERSMIKHARNGDEHGAVARWLQGKPLETVPDEFENKGTLWVPEVCHCNDFICESLTYQPT